MSYTPHRIFTPPSENSVIWRYTNFIKFVDLIQRSSLFFSRADKLGDTFEGSYSKENIRQRPLVYKEISPRSLDQMSSLFEGMTRHTYLNCWHLNDYESSAMWSLYARYDEGIAIQSTFSNLTESFALSKEEVYIGKVNYADYDTDWIPEGNILYPYLYKRKSFEHEKELRALVEKFPIEDGKFKLDKETPIGLYVKVDLKKLIDIVYISPLSPEWVHTCVENILKKYDLEIEISHSTLSDKPVY